MEVIRDLATTAGVELDERPLSPAERQARREAESERDRMYRAMDLAAQFYQDAYAGPAGEAARAYVAKRGITRRDGRALPRRLRARHAGTRCNRSWRRRRSRPPTSSAWAWPASTSAGATTSSATA